MIEQWKTISSAQNYQISNHGNVRTIDKVPVAIRLNKGKSLVSLKTGLGSVSTTVHSIVSSEFIGDRPSGHCIWHIDRNKRNNKSSNLEYITHRERSIRAGMSSGRSSTFRGVSWDKQSNKWTTGIYHNGKRHYLIKSHDEKLCADIYAKAESAVSVGNFDEYIEIIKSFRRDAK